MSDSANQCAIVHQAPLSMGFSRQAYWSGLPFPYRSWQEELATLGTLSIRCSGIYQLTSSPPRLVLSPILFIIPQYYPRFPHSEANLVSRTGNKKYLHYYTTRRNLCCDSFSNTNTRKTLCVKHSYNHFMILN